LILNNKEGQLLAPSLARKQRLINIQHHLR
jgi:hypothetical protein